ncbi:MAG TPA: hypothetical protein DEP82_14760, partial [Arthrobacter bacterium]|nr:hypothetical protein [Arthrobacter sp.]
MGMSDQYDDGRYDSLPEVPDATPGYTLKEAGLLIEGERYNPKTDQWLPAGDPRLPKYQGVERGHTELPGGWCIPNSQMPDLYYKITARDFHGTPVKITTEGNTM